MAEDIQTPDITDILFDGEVASVQFHTWMTQVTEALLPPETGIGSPEGVVVSTTGRWYIDTNAPVGSGIYFKESGEGNTGWVSRS